MTEFHRDQQAHAYPPIDHHARYGVSPITAKPDEQPGAHPLARYTWQDLAEEHPDSRHSDHCDRGHPRITHCERIDNIAPTHAQERDLEHNQQCGECRPAKIQPRDGGQDLAQFNLPRDIPKTRSRHEHLGGNDCKFFDPATARPLVISRSLATLIPALSQYFLPAGVACRASRGKRLWARLMAEATAKFKRGIAKKPQGGRIDERSRGPR